MLGKAIVPLHEIAKPAAASVGARRRPAGRGPLRKQRRLRESVAVADDDDVESEPPLSRGSTVCSPEGSVVGEGGASEMERLRGVAEQEGVCWTKLKGHPFWPTQVVRMSDALRAEERFMTASRFKRKGDDTVVMYFGTCEIAYVCAEKACLSWGAGLERGLHLTMKGRAVFQRALQEVKEYCARNTRYPRGWWCEPQCMALAAELVQECATPGFQDRCRSAVSTAVSEKVVWAKMRGFPYWPVQLLPKAIVLANYPTLKLPSMPASSVTCMYFGTGEVAVVPERNTVPFGAGLTRGYVADSERHDFHVALGEAWGYLKTPRVWPSGFLSGQLWWNADEAATAKIVEKVKAVVPDMPVYEHIRKSVWAVEGVEPPARLRKTEVATCNCAPLSRLNRKTCIDNSCLNYISHFICDPSTCPAGANCGNIAFHKRKSPRLKPFYTKDGRGWGLLTREPIASGTFIVEYVGEIIDRKTVERRLDETQREGSSDYYIMGLKGDYKMDAARKGNLSRFINSSCAPNCATRKWTDAATGQTHVGIFAIKDIAAGTEVTYNYCFEDFGLAGKKRKRSFSCKCGTADCCMLDPIERELMRKLVGKRLEVRWDCGWYAGIVERYNPRLKLFHIEYDDGDYEDLSLGLSLGSDDHVPFRLIGSKR